MDGPRSHRARATKFKVRTCPEADADHAHTPRVFAHMGHRSATICVAQGFRSELPANYVYGILLHELGHMVLAHDLEHSELEADLVGGQLAGVRIYRRSWGPLQRLEFVRTEDLPAARRVVRAWTDFQPLRGEPWTVSR